jgi:Asp-tRNA(Asn)/Glu-tRNA(Gln) amidotransferase A subunit family amidase
MTALEIAATVGTRASSVHEIIAATMSFTAIFAERALSRAPALDALIAAGVDPGPLPGVPVVTVPVVTHGALPVGVQLIGRPDGESLLLAVAEELERRGVVGAGAMPVAA